MNKNWKIGNIIKADCNDTVVLVLGDYDSDGIGFIIDPGSSGNPKGEIHRTYNMNYEGWQLLEVIPKDTIESIKVNNTYDLTLLRLLLKDVIYEK